MVFIRQWPIKVVLEWIILRGETAMICKNWSELFQIDRFNQIHLCLLSRGTENVNSDAPNLFYTTYHR